MDICCSNAYSRKLETTRSTSIGKELNKFWNIHTIKYNAIFKKDKMALNVLTWKEL